MRARFALLIASSASFGPLSALAIGEVLPVAGSLAVSSLVLAGAVASFLKPKESWPWIFLCVALSLGIPTHYAATGVVIQKLGFQNLDQVLLDFDTALFGAVFPSGQISFWLDQSEWLGPHTFAGKVLTELLQVAYFSYYFWGYGLMLWLLYISWLHRSGRDRNPEAWPRLQSFLCAWLGAYTINFISYMFVPAIGPQFVFAPLYQHPLEGFLGIATAIRSGIGANQATLQDCFPSGHTAISWIIAIYALRYAPWYGRLAATAAALITAATLYLRYHYVVDLLAAVPLVLAGLVWGGFFAKPARPETV